MYYIISEISFVNGKMVYSVNSFTQDVSIAELVKAKYMLTLGDWLRQNVDSLTNASILIDTKFSQGEVYYTVNIETTAFDSENVTEITNSNQLLWL